MIGFTTMSVRRSAAASSMEVHYSLGKYTCIRIFDKILTEILRKGWFLRRSRGLPNIALYVFFGNIICTLITLCFWRSVGSRFRPGLPSSYEACSRKLSLTSEASWSNISRRKKCIALPDPGKLAATASPRSQVSPNRQMEAVRLVSIYKLFFE